MKKSFFYAVALLLAGTVMTACSGGDDVTSDVTPEPQYPTEADVVELSGTFEININMTRTINENGKGAWEIGDQFAIYYLKASGAHATAIATVNSVTSEDYRSYANFTATLYSPKTGSTDVKLVYPLSAHDGKGGFKTDALMNQVGTLEYINQKGLDIETASTIMSVEGTTATLTKNVKMEPQVCLYEMRLQDNASYPKSLSATKLEINDGTHNYTITPAAATNTFTVALLPVEDANFTFNALTTEEGKIYIKQNVTLATCTSANVGHVIVENGDICEVSNGSGIIYGASFNNRTLNKGTFYAQFLKLHTLTNPVAMIAYVGENGSVETGSDYRGLAIAMYNCNKYNSTTNRDNEYDGPEWCEQSSTTCTEEHSDDVTVARKWKNGISMTSYLVNHSTGSHNHWAAKAASTFNVSHPSTTSDWFLASLGQWQLILMGLVTKVDNMSQLYSDSISTSGNPKMTIEYLRPVLENAGTGFTTCYWTSSEYNAGQSWYVAPSYGSANSYSKRSDFHDVRAVLAF